MLTYQCGVSVWEPYIYTNITIHCQWRDGAEKWPKPCRGETDTQTHVPAIFLPSHHSAGPCSLRLFSPLSIKYLWKLLLLQFYSLSRFTLHASRRGDSPTHTHTQPERGASETIKLKISISLRLKADSWPSPRLCLVCESWPHKSRQDMCLDNPTLWKSPATINIRINGAIFNSQMLNELQGSL